VIWWEKSNEPTIVHGCLIERHIVLPPSEIGDGGRLARMLWEDKRIPGRPSYRERGYVWHEAETLAQVQELQSRMIAQERRIQIHMGQVDHASRQRTHAEVASRLRQRMTSSSCSPFERDFIAQWLELREDKQAEYTKKWDDHNYYLQVAEFDDKHDFRDRMVGGAV